MSTGLIKYDAACQAIAAARNVDEVQKIRESGAALAAYARIAKNKQLEADAAEIRIRAERRIGQMMAEQRETVGLAKPPGKRRDEIGVEFTPMSTPTLEESGIDKNLAKSARKLAKLPDSAFEKKVDSWREQVLSGESRVTVDILQKPTHVSQNSGENEWYTPDVYIGAAVATLGHIDCDPASSAIANARIGADTYYTIQNSGLTAHVWGKRVWMNPPYSHPEIGLFCESLLTRFRSGEIQAACVLVNNATETEWFQTLLSCASMVCFPKGRIKFFDPQGNPSGAPLQGQAVVYLGASLERFWKAFHTLGSIVDVRHE